MFSFNPSRRVSTSQELTIRSATWEALERRTLLAATPTYEVIDATELQTHQQYGVTASWNVAYSLGLSDTNGNLTLTLQEVPAHAVISVDFMLGGYVIEDSPGEEDTVEVTAAGQSLYSGNVNQGDGFVYGGDAYIEHAEQTVAIQFSASGFESSDRLDLGNMTVGVYLPNINIESEVITVNKSEEVTLTAKDEWNNPMKGVTIDLESSAPNIIAPRQSSVATDEYGVAIVDVNAIAPGYANLKARLDDLIEGQAQQAALRIENAFGEAPGDAAVQVEIDRLGHEDPNEREVAQANLTIWCRQFGSVWDALKGRRNDEQPEIRTRVNSILITQGVRVELNPAGPSLSLDEAILEPGETAESFSLAVDAEKAVFIHPLTAEETGSLLTVPIAHSGGIELRAAGTGDTEISIIVNVRRADGTIRSIQTQLMIRITAEAV